MDRLHTISEACDILRVSRTTLYQLLGSGELASVHIGTRRLITSEALRQFVEANTEVSA